MDDDLTLSGKSEEDYTVTLTGAVHELQAKASFKLKLRNPCIDPSIVEIRTKALEPQDYVLYSETEWTHAPFILETKPFQHSLCGAFTYTATFMSEENVLSADSKPMSYESDTRTFKIYSEDLELMSEWHLTISARLKAYP